MQQFMDFYEIIITIIITYPKRTLYQSSVRFKSLLSSLRVFLGFSEQSGNGWKITVA